MAMAGYWQNKKVLVTGGAGFIGSHLVELLLNEGARVRVADILPKDNAKHLAGVIKKIDYKKLDLSSGLEARRVCWGMDVVMNLAARVGGIEYNSKHPASIFRENMLVFMNVIEAAYREKVKRFLVVSSACVYPRACSIPTREEDGMQGCPEPTNEGYGWAKRMEEYLGAAYHHQYGMEVAIARPYNCYGPRDNFDPASSHVIPALIHRAFGEKERPLKVWGDGTHSRSFLYVEDFARGLLAVCEKVPDARPVNIGEEREVTVRELAEKLREISGEDFKIVYDKKALTGQPRRKCDCRLLRRLTGFKTEVSFEQGLRNTVAWYLAQRREGSGR